LRLRDEGFDVLAVDRQGAALADLEAEGIRTLVADLTSEHDRDRVVSKGEGAHALANVAGATHLKPIFEVEIEDLRAMFAANVEHVWDLTSRIGRTMPPGSAIVNVSSSAAKHPVFTDAAAYAAAKTAILSITRSFAYALAPHVRVNAICPGAIDTPMRDAAIRHHADASGSPPRRLAEERAAAVPLRRVASAEECAGAMWYLLSEASSFMTGQALNFTGGLVTW
jgi:NAD(P)-dependent dehydrogenase (short-subunit alcohol dehydrogenase family)